MRVLLFSGMKQSKRGKKGVYGSPVHAKFLQLCLTLCSPMDSSMPGSSVHGILQARILEWVACLLPGDLPNPGIKPMSPLFPALAGGSLPLVPCLLHRGAQK